MQVRVGRQQSGSSDRREKELVCGMGCAMLVPRVHCIRKRAEGDGDREVSGEKKKKKAGADRAALVPDERIEIHDNSLFLPLSLTGFCLESRQSKEERDGKARRR